MSESIRLLEVQLRSGVSVGWRQRLEHGDNKNQGIKTQVMSRKLKFLHLVCDYEDYGDSLERVHKKTSFIVNGASHGFWRSAGI